MLQFPFDALATTVSPNTRDNEAWWRRHGGFPIAIRVEGFLAKVGKSEYRLTPFKDGFVCTRPNSTVPLGEIYEYGVRKALTNTFFHELGALRAVIYGKTCPAPLCYEMRNGDLVHPGPCFQKHPSSLIRKTRYNLTEDADLVCAVCQERFV